jgi:hypothetical protein
MITHHERLQLLVGEISLIMNGAAVSAKVFVQRTVAQIREAAELAVTIQKNFEELGE